MKHPLIINSSGKARRNGNPRMRTNLPYMGLVISSTGKAGKKRQRIIVKGRQVGATTMMHALEQYRKQVSAVITAK